MNMLGNENDYTKEILEKIEYLSQKNILGGIVADLNKLLYIVHGVNIVSRIKSLDSALEKMQRKNYSRTEEISDLAGIMITTRNVKDVYFVKNLLIDHYTLMEGNDYIKAPRNGYKSLHLSVLINNTEIEIQVKTNEMKKAQKIIHKYIYKNDKIPKALKPVAMSMGYPVIRVLERLRRHVAGIGRGKKFHMLFKETGNKNEGGISMNTEKKLFDAETIRQARSADLVDYCRSKGYSLEKEGTQYRLPGHGGLIIQGKMWYSHAEQLGGNTLDFLVKIEKKNFSDAVKELTREISRESIGMQPKIIEKEQVQEVELPEFSKDMKRTFSYLMLTRGLNKTVVQDCVHEKKIYESVEYHVKDDYRNRLIEEGVLDEGDARNKSLIRDKIKSGQIKEYYDLHNVCFVGRDSAGVIQYGMERSTLTNSSYKHELAGSNKNFNFCIEGKSDRLILCESAIEVMSVASIERMYEKNYKKDHKLSCGGVSDKSLEQYLKDHTEIKTIVVAFNKDPDLIDGKHNVAKDNVQRAVEKIYEKYGSDYVVEKVEPDIGKDWNDMLKSFKGKKPDIDKPLLSIGKLLGEYKRVEVYERKRDINPPNIKM